MRSASRISRRRCSRCSRRSRALRRNGHGPRSDRRTFRRTAPNPPRNRRCMSRSNMLARCRKRWCTFRNSRSRSRCRRTCRRSRFDRPGNSLRSSCKRRFRRCRRSRKHCRSSHNVPAPLRDSRTAFRTRHCCLHTAAGSKHQCPTPHLPAGNRCRHSTRSEVRYRRRLSKPSQTRSQREPILRSLKRSRRLPSTRNLSWMRRAPSWSSSSKASSCLQCESSRRVTTSRDVPLLLWRRLFRDRLDVAR
jgi:hypothetical protein